MSHHSILDEVVPLAKHHKRWIWYQWKDPDRPWVGSEAPVNDLDQQLFRDSTSIIVGNGQKAEF